MARLIRQDAMICILLRKANRPQHDTEEKILMVGSVNRARDFLVM